MYALATSTVSIFRGTTLDDFGDEVDDDTTPTMTAVPVALLETSELVVPVDGSAPSVVRYVAGRVGFGTDIKAGDRLQDERSGAKYTVDFVSHTSVPTGLSDLQLRLRLVDIEPS